jgi:Ca-activated chloride channel family protein
MHETPAMAVQGRKPAWWATVALVGFLAGAAGANQDAQPTFRAGVDLVTVRAVVRDGRGRPVTHLEQSDFVLLDRGMPKRLTSFHQDPGPVGLALLFDVSGSMDMTFKLDRARETAFFLLGNLRSGSDEAAVYAFDSRLHLVQPFTTDLDNLRGRLTGISPWGQTALHDAIASAAQVVDPGGKRRRALVVLTDGIDTSSRLAPTEVSRIASAIDVPVYVMTIVTTADAHGPRARLEAAESPDATLADLARWTGGDLFITTTAAESSQAARRILDELRHQYLLAFEPGAAPGWHPLEVRVKNKNYVVRARAGYVAGQSRSAS